MTPQLIFDIGMCNGDDSAYYLSLGHNVVAVDANPILTGEGEQRFAAEISQGRMTVVNAGILGHSGEFSFYRNLTDPGFSSFDRTRGTQGGKWEELRIPCITTRELMERFGKPFFMKVDIEGRDIEALKTLNRDLAPAYVSLELNLADSIVEALIDLGYSAFKFVYGETYRPAPPIFNRDVAWRLLRRAGRLVPPLRTAIASLPPKFRDKDEYNPPGKYSPDGYPFTHYSSGPFGEQVAGRWMEPGEARRWFDKLRKGFVDDGLEATFWWDVHARHGSVSTALIQRDAPA
jgi:FkbM family methyltransferase